MKLEEDLKTQETLTDIAYSNIKKDITEGYLKLGSKIVIRKLSERYNISSTPIKQALNRLVMQGYVISVPNCGMQVKKVTWSEISDILDVRLMMDLYFLKVVIMSLEDNAEMQKLFRDNITAHLQYAKISTSLLEYQTVYQMDHDFHGLYIKCSNNEEAIQIYNSMNTHSYSTYLYGKQPRSKTIDGVLEHQMIFDSLCEGDEEKAKSYLKLHYRNARETIYSTLKTTKSI